MSRAWRRWGLALACACLPLFAAAPVAAAPVFENAGFDDQLVASGFDQPTAFAYTPDGRTFVAEKGGRVRVVLPGHSAPEAGSVIDISSRVNSSTDRGLLGLAVDSNYASNHYVYLLYTYENNALDFDGPKVSKLGRFTIDQNNNASAETVILGTSGLTACPDADNAVDCIPSEYVWHSIGTVKSDADGTLWVGSGDSQMSLNFSPKTLLVQNENTYRGKILHIDRNGKGLPGHPFCPSDSNLDHVCTKVYAKGFRNPFRFTLRAGKGPIVGDVGADNWEEVDLVQPGGNYGWPCYEGNHSNSVHASAPLCQALPQSATAAPVYEYAHESGNAVAAGPLYTATNYPGPYRGDIFVADFAGGWVRRLKVDSNDQLQSVEPFADFAPGESSPVDLEQTPGGDVAYLDIGFTSNQDGIHKFVWTPGNRSPVAAATGSPLAGATPLTVHFDATASTDPDGDALSYAWNFGDGTTGSGATPSHTYGPSAVNRTATVTVTDGRGGSSSTTVGPITPGNEAPVATLDAPATFRYGDNIALQGSATDAEDGNLADAQLKWRVTQQHGNHTHPFGDYAGPHVTFNARTDHDSDSYFTVRLTAADARGATDIKTVGIRPETAAFTLASRPAGIPLSYGSVTAPSPLGRTSAIGFVATIAAPASYDLGGTIYDFLGWSDGGERQHEVAIPAAETTVTAAYNGHPSAAIDTSRTSADLVVTLSGAGSRDPEGEALSYAWDFGDGTTGTGERVEHRFSTPVSYPVSLTVTDPLGASSSVTRTVPVGVPETGATLVKLRLSRSGVRLSSGGTLSFKLTNPSAKTAIGDLKLTMSRRVRVGRAKAKKMTLGDAAFILAPHTNRTLKVRLSKANRKLVAKLRKVPVVVTWRASERGSTTRLSGRSTSNVLAPTHKR